MQLSKINKEKTIYIIIIFIALIGFALPAINVNISLLGISKNINAFNMVSFFSESDTQFGGLDLTKTDISALTDGNNILGNTGIKLIISVVAYFAVMILLIIIIICTFAGKLKKTSNVLLGVSFILYIYVGHTISTLTENLFSGIENALGFFASFIDISKLVQVNLKSGYLITLGAIGCLMLIKVVMYIIDVKKKNM